MKTNGPTRDNSRGDGITRRTFIKGVAAGAVGVLLPAVTARAAPSESFAGRPDRYGVLVDLTRCIGCRLCEAACNKVNDLPAPAVPFDDKSVFERKRRPDATSLTVVNRYANKERLGEPVYRKVQCMHCDEPACVSACLVGALQKTPEGPVTWDESVCLGCRYCMNACPFYVPAYEYNNAFSPRVQKCSMCYQQRIAKGKVPACATECPVEALTFGKRSDLLKIARDRFRNHPGKYIEQIYGEQEAGGTGWLYIGAVPFEQVDLPTDIENVPYPTLTRDFLTIVPLVLSVWPPLLGGFFLASRSRQAPANAGTDKPKGEDHQS